MQNNNCKNPNTQLPDQVAAVNEFRKLIGTYFEMNNLSNVNQLLTEMLSSSIGPDPRSGKHTPISIANALYDVNNIIHLITKTKPLANEEAFQHYTKNLGYHLQAVGQFEVEQHTDLLYHGLNAYIFQEDDFEGATLNFSAEITAAYKMIYDWLSDCNDWYTAFKQRIQIN
jgi:hypothetical protein